MAEYGSRVLSDAARLATLREAALVAAASAHALDRLTRLARELLRAPFVVITLVDGNAIAFCSQTGVPEPWASRGRMPHSHGFCSLVVETGRPVALDDAREHGPDSHRAALELGQIAYAGVPIRVGDHVIGTMAIADRVPRSWTDRQLQLLQDLGDLAAQQFSVRTAPRSPERAADVGTETDAAASGPARSTMEEERFDAVPDAVLLLDPATLDITDANPAACALFGRARNDLVGTPIKALLIAAEDDYTRLRELLISRPSDTFWYARYRRADQGEGILEATAARLEGDEPPMGLLVLRDVTTRTHPAEKMRGMSRLEAVGRLAGGIAHDFNSLLTAIQGYAQLAIDELDPGAPAQEHVQKIRGTVQRAADLTRQLLAFGRKQILLPRPIGLTGVVTELYPLLRRLVGERIQLVTELNSGPVQVEADPAQIRQALLDLVLNAKEAMPQGGTITITTATTSLEPSRDRPYIEAGDYVMLSVADEGPGIEPALVDKVFEPFFTTKEPGRGAGLGLSTVYGIVKQSGGYIWIDPEPGRGTTVKIYLPLMADAPVEPLTDAPDEGVHDPAAVPGSLEHGPAGAEPMDRAPESDRGTPPTPASSLPASEPDGRTVLLVEDEDPVREVVRRVLEKAGFHVIAAANGEDALSAASEHDGPIHLLLTDVVMPGIQGDELATRLATLFPSIRVLFMSGYTEEDTVRRKLDGTATAFLPKPFAPSMLIRAVRDILDAPAPNQDTEGGPPER